MKSSLGRVKKQEGEGSGCRGGGLKNWRHLEGTHFTFPPLENSIERDLKKSDLAKIHEIFQWFCFVFLIVLSSQSSRIHSHWIDPCAAFIENVKIKLNKKKADFFVIQSLSHCFFFFLFFILILFPHKIYSI